MYRFWFELSGFLVVSKNGEGDFNIIQDAINSGNNQKTILVLPGIYKENINLNSDIFLKSLYSIRQDSFYIETTIIDGDKSGTSIYLSGASTLEGLQYRMVWGNVVEV